MAFFLSVGVVLFRFVCLLLRRRSVFTEFFLPGFYVFLYVTFSTAFSNVPHLHQVVPSFPNVLLGFYVFFQFKPIEIDLYPVLPSVSMFDRVFTFLFQFLPSFATFYRVLSSFPAFSWSFFYLFLNFHRVLLRSTGFYRVLPSFCSIPCYVVSSTLIANSFHFADQFSEQKAKDSMKTQ